ncbi:hypothetical protein ACFFRR_006466 [Megaselia abdita]
MQHKVYKFFLLLAVLQVSYSAIIPAAVNDSSIDFFELRNSSLLVIEERIKELPSDKVVEGNQIYNETLTAYQICYDVERVLWLYKQCIGAHHKMAMERLNSLASSEYWQVRKSFLTKLGERIAELTGEKRKSGEEVYKVAEEGIDICYRTVRQVDNFKLCVISHFNIANERITEIFRSSSAMLSLSTLVAVGCLLVPSLL